MPDEIHRDANGYDYSKYPAERSKKAQRVANESWPMQDAKGKHARGINDQPVDNQRQVLVRLELADDGEVVLPGRATRWNRSHVFCVVDDPRVPNQMIWLRARDVKPA